MVDVPPHQIWCRSVPPTLRSDGAKGDPKVQKWEISHLLAGTSNGLSYAGEIFTRRSCRKVPSPEHLSFKFRGLIVDSAMTDDRKFTGVCVCVCVCLREYISGTAGVIFANLCSSHYGEFLAADGTGYHCTEAGTYCPPPHREA